MQALELTIDSAAVVEGALKEGLLVNRTAEKVVRILPALTVTVDEITEAASILDRVLTRIEAGAQTT
jgi:acetylornithine/succinyldiaminopimelate/putrescine aminotransferase